MTTEYIYSTPYSQDPTCHGTTYRQRKMVLEDDGTMTSYHRYVTPNAHGSMADCACPAWQPRFKNMEVEMAREIAAKWVEQGFTRACTREAGLETWDAEYAVREARRHEIRKAREARRAAKN